eukprot:GAFH01001131.1.p2 GENE.GAFH01001131.1~~GAFH01001131.1.p2  ORF type:complete len:274 (-),score=67.88 GAFH01001131.1:31-852(-)
MYAPSPLPGGPLIVCVAKKTALHTPTNQPSCRVVACSKANIYVLASVRDCAVLSCENCTIFVGAVRTVLSLDHCQRCTVVAACGRVRVSNCTETVIHLLTPSGPVIFPSNKALQLAPYNSCFPGLTTCLASACLTPATCTAWNRAIVTESHTEKAKVPATEGDTEGQPYTIMPPERFHAFYVPFITPGDTTENPAPLPPEYAVAVQEKEATIDAMRRNIRDAHLEPDAERRLQVAIQRRFKEWLVSSGNMRQINDLLHMAEKGAEGTGAVNNL